MEKFALFFYQQLRLSCLKFHRSCRRFRQKQQWMTYHRNQSLVHIEVVAYTMGFLIMNLADGRTYFPILRSKVCQFVGLVESG